MLYHLPLYFSYFQSHLTLKSGGDLKIPLSTSSLEVRRCARVNVNSNAFSQLAGLRKIQVSNVTEIVVLKDAFMWNKRNKSELGIEISIINATIDDLPSYAFSGRYDVITFENVHMKIIKPFAITNLQELERLEVRSCVINLIDSQAFKKFTVDNFFVTNCNLENIQNRAMFELVVRKEARFDNLKIGAIRNKALVLHGPRQFHFTSNQLGLFETEAIQVNASGPVFVQNNIVGKLESDALAGIQPNIGAFRQMTFSNNTFERFENRSLVFSKRYDPGIDLRINNIFLDQPCFCHCFSQIAGELSHADSNKKLSPLVTTLIKATSCRKDNQQYIRLEEFQNKTCTHKSNRVPVIVGVVVSLVLLLIIIVLLVVFCKRRARKRRLGVRRIEQQEKKFAITKEASPSRYMMVVPDVKTYRETEVHVIVEKAEPLQHEEFPLQDYNDEDDDNETAVKY